MIKKELSVPILYTDKKSCCGCTACYAVCPVHAIAMKADQEGFLYPEVNAEICIKCYKCLSVCAFKRDQEEKGYKI